MERNLLESSNLETNRALIQQKRNERKKQKKELKQKELERKQLHLKYGPTDTHVTIITRQFADTLMQTNTIRGNNNEFMNDQFPALSATGKIKPDITTTTSVNTTNSVTSASKLGPKNFNLLELLQNKSKSKSKSNIPKPVKSETKIKPYEGNILDSSHPERKKGKHREFPKPKRPSKIKSLIIMERENQTVPEYDHIHSPQFETYCDNIITDELNETITSFLDDIVRYQERMYNNNPIKGSAKRRYTVGLHEVKKYLIVNKIRIVIIAPNIKTMGTSGVLDNVVHDLVELAVRNNVPYVFALARRKLGQLMHKYIPISCVGLLNYDGAEQTFAKILELINTNRLLYQNMKLIPESLKNNDNSNSDNNDDGIKEIIQGVINVLKTNEE